MSDLSKSLGGVTGTALMLNTVLGAGVLILPGLAAAQVGAQSLWTWVACAIVTAPLLAVFAILSSRYPEAGGVGHIAKIAFGAVGQVAASALLLGAVFLGLPSIALTAGYYLEPIVGAPPAAIAILVVACAGSLNLALPDVASKIGAWVAAAVIAFLVILIAAASVTILNAQAVLDAPTISAAEGATSTMPLTTSWPNASLFVPFMLVFFAFTGWEVAIGTSEEFRDPRRDIPRAVAASFAITVLFYVVCAVVVLSAGETAYGNAPFLAILAPNATGPASTLIAGGTGILLTANLFAAIWAVSRMLLSLARERLLPLPLARVSMGTPRIAVVATVAIIAGVAALDGLSLINVEILFALAGQNFLLLYAVSAAALVALATRPLDWTIGLCALVVAIVAIALTGLHFIYPIALVLLGLGTLWARNRRTGVWSGDSAATPTAG